MMQFDDFVGQVMDELQLGEKGRGVRAVRATLSTLSERLHEGEATDLAAALPMEIDHYVLMPDHGERFDFDELVERVAEIEDIDEASAQRHAQIVAKVTAEAIPEGQMQDIMQSLPEDYGELFELVE